MARSKYLFMLVTNDIYEFPITILMSAKEMAEITGLKAETVRWYASPTNQRRREKIKSGYNKYKIVAVPVAALDD